MDETCPISRIDDPQHSIQSFESVRGTRGQEAEEREEKSGEEQKSWREESREFISFSCCHG